MFKLTKRLSDFSTCHRLNNGYLGKCKNLHGHNYKLEITVIGNILNRYGMLMDFNDIKKYFDNWVQTNWDHATIVNSSDKTLLKFLKAEGQSHFVMHENTTVEGMSKFLADIFMVAAKEQKLGLQTIKVKIWETEDSSCESETSCIDV